MIRLRTSPMLARWLNQGDRLDERAAGVDAALELKRDDGADALGGVLVGGGVPGARRQAGVVDRGDVGVVFEPLGDLLRVLHVTLDAQAQRFDALDERECAVRGERCAGVAQQLDAGLDDVRDAVAENRRVARTVVRRVGLGQTGELVDVLRPRELSAVDDDAGDDRAVSAEELGGGVNNDVGAVLGTGG